MAKNLVLYPGNIQKVEWHLARVVPFMSHIVIDHDGKLKPLAHAILKQNDEIVGVTNDDGFIQADILSTSTELAFEKGDQTCHIQLPTISKDDLYIWQSQIECR